MKFAYTAACISDIRILDIKVADVLMMNLVAVATTQTSGYCHYTENLTAQVLDTLSGDAPQRDRFTKQIMARIPT